jgi:hypothetical protein
MRALKLAAGDRELESDKVLALEEVVQERRRETP